MVAVVGAALAVLVGLVQPWISIWGWPRSARSSIASLRTKHPRLAFALGLPIIVVAAVGGGLFLGPPLIGIAFLLGVAILGLILSIVPLAGHQAGLRHIDDWVIAPQICIAVKSQQERLKPSDSKTLPSKERPRATSCVVVKKDNEEYRGRVVFSTFNTVVLFEPDTGAVRRVPTDGASVEVIGELPRPTAGKALDSTIRNQDSK